MSFLKKGLVLIAMCMFVACVCWAIADENTDALAKAPKAVQDVVRKTIGSNSLEGFDKELEDGKTIYEVNYKVGSTDYAIIVDEAGKILEREVEVDMSFVPPHILAAAKKAQPTGKIAEVTVVFADNKLFFEVESTVGKDMHEIKINPDGKVTADTVAKPEAASTEAGEVPDKEEAPKTK